MFPDFRQVVADFFTMGLSKDQIGAAFDGVPGNIFSVNAFNGTTSLAIIIQTPPNVLAGTVQVKPFKKIELI